MPASAESAANNSGQLIDLLYSMDRAYRNSKYWLLFSLVSAVASVALLAILYLEGQRALAALVALALQSLAYGCKRKSIRWYRRGHELERAAILNHGLSEPHPCSVKKRPKESEKYKTYFYSSRPRGGARRLIEDIAECSYFTKDIADTLHSFYFGLVVTGFALVILAFFGAVVLVLNILSHSNIDATTLENYKTYAEVAFIALAFLGFGELAVVHFQYGLLEREMSQIYNEAEKYLQSPSPLKIRTGLSLLMTYSCALMDSPPLPKLFYRKNQSRLNQEWREDKGKELSELPGNADDEVI